MWRKFCGFMLRALGWTAVDPVVEEKKCIILGAPHTSIMDFVVSYFYYESIGGNARCLIKKEFFFPPLSWLLKSLGGIPVDRQNATSFLRSVIKEIENAETFHLALSPEGTRKPVKRWKAGFHLIATKANIPVYLGYFDWGTKRIGRGERFELSDNADADLKRIQEIYENMHLTGKHKEGYITH